MMADHRQHASLMGHLPSALVDGISQQIRTPAHSLQSPPSQPLPATTSAPSGHRPHLPQPTSPSPLPSFASLRRVYLAQPGASRSGGMCWLVEHLVGVLVSEREALASPWRATLALLDQNVNAHASTSTAQITTESYKYQPDACACVCWNVEATVPARAGSGPAMDGGPDSLPAVPPPIKTPSALFPHRPSAGLGGERLFRYCVRDEIVDRRGVLQAPLSFQHKHTRTYAHRIMSSTHRIEHDDVRVLEVQDGMLATASADRVRVFSADSAELLWSRPAGPHGNVSDIALFKHRGCTVLAIGHADGVVELFKTQERVAAEDNTNAPIADAESGRRRHRLTSGSEGSSSPSSSSESDESLPVHVPLLHKYRELVLNYDTTETTVIQFDSTTASIVVGGRSGILVVWDADTGALKATYYANGEVCLLQCCQGRAVACALGQAPMCIDLATGRVLFRLIRSSDIIVGLRVNTHFIATCSNAQIDVWRAKTGTHLHQIQFAACVASLSFHPHMKDVLAVGLENSVEVWSLTGESRRSFAALEQADAISETPIQQATDSELALYTPRRFLVGIAVDGGALVASRISPTTSENALSILQFSPPASSLQF